MNIVNISPSGIAPFADLEAVHTALLACGFSEETLREPVTVFASLFGGVTELIAVTAAGEYYADDIDGWNDVNGVMEIGGFTAADFEKALGEGASRRPVIVAYLATRGS